MAKYDPIKYYKKAGLDKTKSGYKVTSGKAKARGVDPSSLPAARIGTLITPPGTKRGMYDSLVKSKVPRQARLYQTKPGAVGPKTGPRLSVGQYQQVVSERKRTAGRMASVTARKKQISAYQQAVKKKTAAPKSTGKKNRLR
jgi:hypothetical protein